MVKPKLVLAYSGGLDTSVILHWLINQGYDVIAYMADLGQREDFRAARDKALLIGATGFVLRDIKQRFLEDFVFQAIKANAIYEGEYLMGTSLARPITAEEQVKVAKEIDAEYVAHGATGKGNDQVRFELTYMSLNPNLKIISPWKEPKFLAVFGEHGRDAAVEYAQKHGIPLEETTTTRKKFSQDANIAHTSSEAEDLEDITQSPLDRRRQKDYEGMLKLSKWPHEAPLNPSYIEIKFAKGIPVEVINKETDEVITGSLALFNYLNSIGGKYGVYIIDMVEDRFIGMKSRGVYEAPAHYILHRAHLDLERVCLDREVFKLSQRLMPEFAEGVYNGFWFSPEMDALRNFYDYIQQPVTGTVKLQIRPGGVDVIGRSSQNSLYDKRLVSMHEAGGHDPIDSGGFIRTSAVRLIASSKRDGRLKEREGEKIIT